MSQSLKERLSEVLPDLPAEDVHGVASFAEFLAGRRCSQDGHGNRQLSREEHAQMLAALNAVALLSLKEGPPVSNRDLYGAN